MDSYNSHRSRRSMRDADSAGCSSSSSSSVYSEESDWSSMSKTTRGTIESFLAQESNLSQGHVSDISYNDFDDDSPSEVASVSFSDVSVSASDMEFITSLEGGKTTLNFRVTGNDEAQKIQRLYQPLFGALSENAGVYEVVLDGTKHPEPDTYSFLMKTLEIPSLALSFILKDRGKNSDLNNPDLHSHFVKQKWTFHHSEGQKSTNSNREFYFADIDAPLCSVIYSKTKRRHTLQLIRFVSPENWTDSINLYSLILGQDPGVVKADQAIFLTAKHQHYSVELVMKKTPKGIISRNVNSVILSFRISQAGHIVPLLPNVCEQTSTDTWATKDLDGNDIELVVVRDDPPVDAADSTSEADDVSEYSDVYATASDMAREVFEDFSRALTPVPQTPKTNTTSPLFDLTSNSMSQNDTNDTQHDVIRNVSASNYPQTSTPGNKKFPKQERHVSFCPSEDTVFNISDISEATEIAFDMASENQHHEDSGFGDEVAPKVTDSDLDTITADVSIFDLQSDDGDHDEVFNTDSNTTTRNNQEVTFQESNVTHCSSDSGYRGDDVDNTTSFKPTTSTYSGVDSMCSPRIESPCPKLQSFYV